MDNHLASMFSDPERHQDALEIEENMLEFKRRWLPENDPQIGEGRCVVWDYMFLIVTRGFWF